MSYQNVAESEISGYNDCPIVEHSRSSKPRRRMHNLSARSSSASISSMSTPPPAGPPPSGVRRASTPVVTQIAMDVSDKHVTEQLDKLFAMPTSLPDREFSHYKNKLRAAVDKGLQPRAKQLIVDSTANLQQTEAAKNEIIRFMLQNDGATVWCTPLRKLLESTV